ncbi:hypothetical protein HN011_010167 [Eciton burchellii]|nr:hypothetical protein HN011_010167 [Eciton burchellii]
MDETHQFFFRNTNYTILRILLSANGLWPFHTLRRRCAIYIVMTLVLGSGFVFQILGTLEVLNDSFEVIDTLPLLLFIILAITEMFCAVYALSQLKVLLIKIKEYCLSAKSNEETRLYNSHAIYARNLSYVYTGVIFSHLALFMTMTLSMRFIRAKSNENISSSDISQEMFIYRVNYMLDPDTYYVPIFMHTATCMMLCTCLMVTFDVLYLTMVETCCGLFAAVRYRLENAFEHKSHNDALPIMLTKDKSYSNVVYSARRHAETIQFVAIVESMYSLSLFVHIASAILILSVLGYQVATNTDKINNLLKVASYLNAVFINIFFRNWQGQKIINFSEKIFQSAYNTEWYNMSIVTRKLLIMIMMRSKAPLLITAGKIIIMSYVTFNTVLRTSSSYFMLLWSL